MGRMDAKGHEVRPINEEKLRRDLKKLAESGVEAITISLINSYANPDHEVKVREIVREMYPNLPTSISSEILPEFREYERTQTAVMNSYVRPVVGRYMDGIASKLKERGMTTRFNILRSDGGLMSVDSAKEMPVYALVSGPAGGVSGALWVAKQAGYQQYFDPGYGRDFHRRGPMLKRCAIARSGNDGWNPTIQHCTHQFAGGADGWEQAAARLLTYQN